MNDYIISNINTVKSTNMFESISKSIEEDIFNDVWRRIKPNPTKPIITNHTYNNGTTTIKWSDSTITTVHSDPSLPTTTEYVGFMIAIAKKLMGNGSKASNLADFWLVKLPSKRKIAEERAEIARIEKLRLEEKRKTKREKNRIRIEAIKRKQSYEAAKVAFEKYGVPMPTEFGGSFDK